MKFKFLFLIVPLTLVLHGCLVVKSFKFQVAFDKKYNMGNITITTEDVRSQISTYPYSNDNSNTVFSTENISKRCCSDFKGLVDYTFKDDVLFDLMEIGVYVKNRRLYEEDNTLFCEYSGIFKKLTFEDEGELIIKDSIIVLRLEADDDVINIETDGVLYEGEKQITITWPKQNNIYWRLIYLESFEKNTHSMIKEFRKWKKMN